MAQTQIQSQLPPMGTQASLAEGYYQAQIVKCEDKPANEKGGPQCEIAFQLFDPESKSWVPRTVYWDYPNPALVQQGKEKRYEVQQKIAIAYLLNVAGYTREAVKAGIAYDPMQWAGKQCYVHYTPQPPVDPQKPDEKRYSRLLPVAAEEYQRNVGAASGATAGGGGGGFVAPTGGGMTPGQMNPGQMNPGQMNGGGMNGGFVNPNGGAPAGQMNTGFAQPGMAAPGGGFAQPGMAAPGGFQAPNPGGFQNPNGFAPPPR